jgi:hypothetical protein
MNVQDFNVTEAGCDMRLMSHLLHEKCCEILFTNVEATCPNCRSLLTGSEVIKRQFLFDLPSFVFFLTVRFPIQSFGIFFAIFINFIMSFIEVNIR